jgi:hypothetical protein|tara:strand:- start:4197 stop:4412 length:216 start_codon:yes stop_codon:yes gene_type:complete
MSTGINNNLQLLGAIQVGKILFKSQPELNNVSLQKRVLHLKDREDLPMKLISGKFVISLRSLEKWIEEKGL